MSSEKTTRKKKRIAGFVIAILVIVCIVIAVIEIKSDFIKLNKAAGYSERIMKLLQETKGKK